MPTLSPRRPKSSTAQTRLVDLSQEAVRIFARRLTGIQTLKDAVLHCFPRTHDLWEIQARQLDKSMLAASLFQLYPDTVSPFNYSAVGAAANDRQGQARTSCIQPALFRMILLPDSAVAFLDNLVPCFP